MFPTSAWAHCTYTVVKWAFSPCGWRVPIYTVPASAHLVHMVPSSAVKYRSLFLRAMPRFCSRFSFLLFSCDLLFFCTQTSIVWRCSWWTTGWFGSLLQVGILSWKYRLFWCWTTGWSDSRLQVGIVSWKYFLAWMKTSDGKAFGQLSTDVAVLVVE